MRNDYDNLYKSYQKTNTKVDKLFSMLPTILQLAQPRERKTIIDVGCGDGFFTEFFLATENNVIGIDNSTKQIQDAKKKKSKVNYICVDMYDYEYPVADIIHASFVINYIQSKTDLYSMLATWYKALSQNGKLIAIIDTPQALVHDNKKFGSIKRLHSYEDGEKIEIELYKNNKRVVTLFGYYHPKELLEFNLKRIGFSRVEWVLPTVDQKGLDVYGKQYWDEYLDNLDVSYFIAYK